MSNDQIIIPEPVPSHEWTSTIKRPDGVIISTTVTVPEGHLRIQPMPTPWDEKGDWTLREMNEITYMCTNEAHKIIERNWAGRDHRKREDRYWANGNQDSLVEAIESKKED